MRLLHLVLAGGMDRTARVLTDLELLALDLDCTLHWLGRLDLGSARWLPRINRVVELQLITVVAVLRRE